MRERKNDTIPVRCDFKKSIKTFFAKTDDITRNVSMGHLCIYYLYMVYLIPEYQFPLCIIMVDGWF